MCSLNIVCVLIFCLWTRETYTWDFAVSHVGGIALGSSTGELLLTAAPQTKPGAMCYDPAEGKLFYGDLSGDSSIRSLDMSDPSRSPDVAGGGAGLVLRRPGDAAVQGVAFDPIERSLYWTDGAAGRRVLRYDLPPVDTDRPLYEASGRRVLFEFDEEMPQAIAVDVCRRKLYWTNANHKRPTIERSNLDGTKREVLVDKDLFIPLGLAIDQTNKRLYWADDKEGIYFRIESSDLDGTDRRVVYEGKDHQPSGLAISPAGTLYWTDWAYKAVWSFDSRTEAGRPSMLHKFYEEPMGVVARMNMQQAYGGADECTAVIEELQNRTEPAPRLELQCLHGLPDSTTGGACTCASGYTGLHCELPVCYNYCLGGAKCRVTAASVPVCDCPAGRAGSRCEVVEQQQQQQRSALIIAADLPSEAKGAWLHGNDSDERLDDVQSASQQPSSVDECFAKSPVAALISLCCILVLTTGALIWKLYHSTRRPRIHKRIIVNKSQPGSGGCLAAVVSPGGNTPSRPITAPETCEITIENCCNMNICETPCFDPVSYREPAEKHKSKKEEKKNLLVGMETADDLY